MGKDESRFITYQQAGVQIQFARSEAIDLLLAPQYEGEEELRSLISGTTGTATTLLIAQYLAKQSQQCNTGLVSFGFNFFSVVAEKHIRSIPFSFETCKRQRTTICSVCVAQIELGA